MSKKMYHVTCLMVSIIFLTLTVNSCANNNSGVMYEVNEDTGDYREDSSNHLEPDYDSEKSDNIDETDSDSKEHSNVEETNNTETFVYVQLCGAVAMPGVYKVDSSRRVFEVLELAGGVTSEADTEVVNLARPVSDEMRIYIPTQEEVAAGQYNGAYIESYIEESAMSDNQKAFDLQDDNQAYNSNTPHSDIFSDDGWQNGLVNINTADKEMLMTLTGIGESRALAIISYREDMGRFNSIEDIMKVTGIKQAAFDKIKDRITV